MLSLLTLLLKFDWLLNGSAGQRWWHVTHLSYEPVYITVSSDLESTITSVNWSRDRQRLLQEFWNFCRKLTHPVFHYSTCATLRSHLNNGWAVACILESRIQWMWYYVVMHHPQLTAVQTDVYHMMISHVSNITQKTIIPP